MGVLDSATAKVQRNGAIVRVAGCVITRQRPGTAKGFVFLSLEDETGIVNIIVHPDLFDRKADVCIGEPYLLIKGTLQNMSNVVSVKAADMEGLSLGPTTITSHDFH
jgi:error-prone DNA polymerase